MNPHFVRLALSPLTADDSTLISLAKYLTRNEMEITDINHVNIVAENKYFKVIIEVYREYYRVRKIIPKKS